MKRVLPPAVYRYMPCSVTAVGCAMGVASRPWAAELSTFLLRPDSYLSLDGMNKLVRHYLPVLRRLSFRRGERPQLLVYARQHAGTPAIICVPDHYVYFDGRDYYSFFWNGTDPVICAWELKKGAKK